MIEDDKWFLKEIKKWGILQWSLALLFIGVFGVPNLFHLKEMFAGNDGIASSHAHQDLIKSHSDIVKNLHELEINVNNLVESTKKLTDVVEYEHDQRLINTTMMGQIEKDIKEIREELSVLHEKE